MPPRLACPLLLLVLTGLALPAAWVPSAWARDPGAPPGPEQIDTAIERGVAWLIAEQRARGSWGSAGHPVGPTALAVHALLHAGVAEDDGTPAGLRLRKALRFLEREGPGREKRSDARAGTYELSLMLLLLRSRGREADRARMQRLADRLVARQASNGQWWYLPDGKQRARTGDNSNSQFAVLALGAAVGEGLQVDAAALARARSWWLGAAQPDGGFGYASGGSLRSASTGSMSAAGIACLAILDAALSAGPDLEDADRATEVRRKATRFLGSVFSVRHNHGPAKGQAGQRQRNAGRGWLHYYLWTVERAMVLHGAETLGASDWFVDGTRHLLETQTKDGSWRQEQPLYATCFALLFLSRAADPPRAFTPHAPRPPVPPAGAPVTGREGAEPPVPAAENGAVRKTPEAAALPAGGVPAWVQEALAPGELAARCRQAGPNALRPLLRALRARDADVRQRAFEALQSLLPEDRWRRVDRHPLPRGRLDLWLALHARDLVLQDGRFVLP